MARHPTRQAPHPVPPAPPPALDAAGITALLEQLDEPPEEALVSVIEVEAAPPPAEDPVPAAALRRPAWSGEEGGPPDPRRLRAAEGERRIQAVIEALVGRLAAAGDLELRAGAAPGPVAERLCAALRQAGGFTQFGRTAARALLADPDVDELFLDDLELTRALEDLG